MWYPEAVNCIVRQRWIWGMSIESKSLTSSTHRHALGAPPNEVQNWRRCLRGHFYFAPTTLIPVRMVPNRLEWLSREMEWTVPHHDYASDGRHGKPRSRTETMGTLEIGHGWANVSIISPGLRVTFTFIIPHIRTPSHDVVVLPEG